MKILVHGAKLQCSHGSAQSSLVVPPMKLSFVSDAPVATSLDFVSQTNIFSFGECDSPKNPQVVAANGTPQPCVPATSSPWSNASSLMAIHGVPVLTEESICACRWNGTIKPVRAGQEIAEIASSSSTVSG
ncbi:DUF4280 domain-containing protein [Pendulispora albinea]|uniref:DUF4280 domain-containing protein n=1 Tax=Pendulispora albinea TaxID=2741071 RepID=UPI00374E17BC